MTGIRYASEVPSAEQFFPLFLTTGWNERQQLTVERIQAGLARTWFAVSAYLGDELVGTGRLISDGCYQCFICDVIIKPDLQGNGIGKEIVQRLVAHAQAQGIRWVQLTSARGKRGFYEKLGFQPRPDDAPGMEIWL